MRFRWPAAAIAAAVLLSPLHAGADVGIGPRFALVRADADTASDRDRLWGGVLRAQLSPRTSLELALDWRTMVNDSLTERIRDYPFQGSLLIYPVRGTLAPYLLGGIGWYSQRVEALGEDEAVLSSTTTRTFGYHAGFGGDLRLGRHAGIHLDYRYKFIRPDEDDPENQEESDFLGFAKVGSMWTGGLTIYF